MNPRTRYPINPALWLMLLSFGLLCAPLITSSSESNYIADEQHFHLPAIRQIEVNWPRLDIEADSLSATAPGYHYLLATAARLVGSDTFTMRAVNFGVSAALLWLLMKQMRGESRWIGLVVVAPLALNNLFIKSACWVVTDNAALLGLSLVVLNLNFAKSSAHLSASVISAGTVFVRQNYAWLLLPLVAWVWQHRKQHSRSANLSGLAVSLLPAMVVGLLYLSWGGLAPARWTNDLLGDRPFTLAPVAMVIAIFGLFGPCYIWLATDRNWNDFHRSRLAYLGAALGGAIALIGPTSYSWEFGRWGGYIWEAVRWFPAPADRSLLFISMSAWGGAVLVILVEVLAKTQGRNTAATWALIVGTWTVSGLLNRQIFQRYFEPSILIFLIIWFIWIQRTQSRPLPRWKPMAGLALGQLSLTLATAYWNVFV